MVKAKPKRWSSSSLQLLPWVWGERGSSRNFHAVQTEVEVYDWQGQSPLNAHQTRGVDAIKIDGANITPRQRQLGKLGWLALNLKGNADIIFA